MKPANCDCFHIRCFTDVPNSHVFPNTDLKSTYFPTVGCKVENNTTNNNNNNKNMVGALELDFTSSSTNLLSLFSK